MINRIEQVISQLDYLDGLGLKINNIYKEFKAYPNVHSSNYTLVGLRKESPVRNQGGAKHHTDYTTTINGSKEVVVRKTFEYVYTDPDTSKIGVWVEHAWYTYSGNKGLIKTEFKPLTIGEMAGIRRKHRSYVRESLIALGGANPTLAQYINILVEHYKILANEFVDLGKAQEWKTAIQNESNTTILAILNATIVHEGRTDTVSNFIIEDLNPHIL